MQHFFDEEVGNLLVLVALRHDQQVDRSDEPADSDGRPESQDGAAGELVTGLGDGNARGRDVDQLAHQPDRVDRRVATRYESSLGTQRVQPINVGYAGLPDEVLHSNSRTSRREPVHRRVGRNGRQSLAWGRTLGVASGYPLDSHASDGRAAEQTATARHE